jgi:hypothetical protein
MGNKKTRIKQFKAVQSVFNYSELENLIMSVVLKQFQMLLH